MDSKHWEDVKCKKYGFPRRVYILFALNGGHLGFIMQVTRPLGTVRVIELNKTGTLPPTGNLKPNFRRSPQSRHAGKSAVKRQNKVFEREKSK